MIGTRKYAYNVLVGIYACPYCGRIVRKERMDYSKTGPKLERCPYCSNIYKSGKKFYSDLSKVEVKKYSRNKYYVALGGLLGTVIFGYLASRSIDNINLFSMLFVMSCFSFCSGFIYLIGLLMWKSNKSDKIKSNDLQLVELENRLSAEMKQKEQLGITDSNLNLTQYSGLEYPSIVFVVKVNAYQQYAISLGETIQDVRNKFGN